MKKVLFVATVVRLHINMFHQPYLRWFHEQGWQVDVAANNDYEDKNACVIPYCDHFYCLPFERSPIKAGNLQAYRQLKDLLKKERYDIIHCHTPMGGVVTRLAAGTARKQGTKVFYTAHGFHFYTGAPARNWLLYYPVERMLAHRTDLLITMNQEDYARAKTFSAKRVAYVHGVGVNLDRFAACDLEQKARVRKTLGLQPGDIFAISVAQLIRRKNHIVLIEAAVKLNRPDFHLFICGDGIQEAELRTKVRELGMEKQIHFLGFRQDIDALCKAADLFVFASLQEGLPVAVMEAMACGLPVICSRIRGNTDLIDEGKGGYLADPTNADEFANGIRQALNNPERLTEMKRYNQKKVEQYSTQHVMEQMTALYRDYTSF